MQILSNDAIVRQCLETIAQTVLENGGEIHTGLTINHKAERLWLSCAAEFTGETLLRIPNALFIPVSHLAWNGDDDVLAYSGDTSILSSPQRIMLDAIVELYNATDKINRVAANFPDSLFRNDTALHTLILKARPKQLLSDKNLAEQFINTRLSTQNNEDSEETIDYIMPLIDMLNHHPFGPKYGRNVAKDWVIPVQHPNANSEECFVRYQKGDSFANALWHGYFEGATHYLSSVQCAFSHQMLGTVTVHGVNYERRKLNTPFVKRVEDGMELISIILAPDTLPALRTFLGLAVRSVNRALTQAQAEQTADGLIDSIIAENKGYFSELREFCTLQQDDFPLRPLFGEVAKHQLALLDDLRAI
jgi:hypothetical protein